LFNHDPNFVFARTKSGTLKLSVDEKGLRYEFAPPKSEQGKSLMESIARGDVDQSSFGFRVSKDSWEDRNGTQVRTIEKLAQLIDISPVTYAAYEDTTVAARSRQRWLKGLHRNENLKKEIETLNL